MSNFSQVELLSIKEVVSGHQLMASKFSSYAGLCQDDNIKKMFQSAAASAQTSAQNLIQML